MVQHALMPGRPDERLELRPVGMPAQDHSYRAFVTTSLSLAVLVGFVIGLHIPLTRLLSNGSAQRTADMVLAHGQVQLLGFAGLFVVGMSLRLLPRFGGGRLAMEPLLPLILWLFVSSLLTRAFLVPWLSGDWHTALVLAASMLMLMAALSFFGVIAATTLSSARDLDASSLSFIVGACFLVVSAVVALGVEMEAATRDAVHKPYLANTAVLQLELPGFLLSFIVGVGLRALPTMTGIDRPRRGAWLIPAGLAASVSVFAVALLYLEYAAYSTAVVRISGAALLSLALVLLAAVWLAGVLRPAANRVRPLSQPHLWLIRSAFVWLFFGAAVAAYSGGSALADGRLPSQFELDAMRHSLGVGMITSLIVGMSLMILPEFAAQRQQRNRQRELAIVLAGLINSAALLRVLPALAGTRWSFDNRNLSMAVAGSIGELAVLLFAYHLLRLIWRSRTPARRPSEGL